MGWHNVAVGNGVEIMLTGMAIVFVGLTLITLYIAGIPKLFDVIRGAQNASAARRQARTAPLEPVAVSADLALMAAIAAVVQMELERERAEDNQRITIERSPSQQIWAAAGKMRTLSTRM